MAGAGGAGGAVAGACAEAEPGPVGGGGSVEGSGAAEPVAEPGSGVGAGAGGGFVPGGEKGSPLGWSLALYKEPLCQSCSGQRERCWVGHADEPASPTPGYVASTVCWPFPSF